VALITTSSVILMPLPPAVVRILNRRDGNQGLLQRNPPSLLTRMGAYVEAFPPVVISGRLNWGIALTLSVTLKITDPK